MQNKTPHTSADLRLHILALEAKSLQQKEDIKKTTAAIVESLKPSNIIRNTFSSTIKTPGFGKNLLQGAAGLAVGFVTKKFLVKGSSSIIKKALGAVVELGVAKTVAKNADKITSSGIKMLGKVMKK